MFILSYLVREFGHPVSAFKLLTDRLKHTCLPCCLQLITVSVQAEKEHEHTFNLFFPSVYLMKSSEILVLGSLVSFLFLTCLLEYNCFTRVCQFLLYNKVNQVYVYIYPHISSLLRLPSILPIPPFQVDTEHRADLPVLCGCFPLFYIWQCIYVHAILSLRPSLPFPLPMSSSPFSTSASLFLSCPQVLQNLSFLFFFFYDCIYMCQHTVFVFLFLTYFNLYYRLQVHPPHYK